ncbi:MAG TPA: hypothetical protein VM600_02435 [Actinomycetota bacterium]|nr:hypothetical protein [Actinomycetota bacterium]
MRSKAVLFAGMMLALGLTTGVAPADHCSDLVIFSGHDTGQQNPNDGSPVRRGLNVGNLTCTAASSDEELNGNVITPGATVAIVGYFGALTDAFTGTLTQGTTVTPLTFKQLNGRWEAQSVTLAPGPGEVTARLFIDGEEFDDVTYKKLA